MLKVLVVDDETDVEFLFRQRFRREQKTGLIELFFAFSGMEALQVMKSSGAADVIIVLSDINMPGMNGFELLRHLKDEHPNVKVCMITAYGDDANEQKAQEYGADCFLHKPLDFEMLKNILFAE